MSKLKYVLLYGGAAAMGAASGHWPPVCFMVGAVAIIHGIFVACKEIDG
jgi:hypothetical protein